MLNAVSSIKLSGFNTINITDANPFLFDILNWCEENEMAVYLFTRYPGAQYPDLMDPELRQKTAWYYSDLVKKIKKYRCILGVDICQKNIFRDTDPRGLKRPSVPALGGKSLVYLPRWLELKYGSIIKLNRAWGKKFPNFTDIMTDTEITQDWRVQDLGTRPWRNDFVDYAQWAESNFLETLLAQIRTKSRNHLLTYSTDLAEPVSLPVQPRANNRPDFISVIHAGKPGPFDRAAAGNVLVKSKFYADIYKLPVYFIDASFNVFPGPEGAQAGKNALSARLHLQESVLLPVLPYIIGWSYLSGPNTLLNCDFGNTPNSAGLMSIWNIINSRVAVNPGGEREPVARIFHPPYLQGSPEGSFRQYAVLVSMLEENFLGAFNEIGAEIIRAVESPAGIMSKELFGRTLLVYKKQWNPFTFASTLAGSNLPVILAGDGLKQLSAEDALKLSAARTISFGEIGTRDGHLRITEPWFLSAAGIKMQAAAAKAVPLDLSNSISGWKKKAAQECASSDCSFTMYRDDAGVARSLECAGQIVPVQTEVYTSLDIAAGSRGADVCEEVELIFGDGSVEKRYFGPTIPSWKEEPVIGHLAMTETADGRPAHLTHFTVPCNPMKILSGIRLPDNPDVRVFSITGNKFGVVRGCDVTVRYGQKSASGRTAWLILVNPKAGGAYRTLAFFSNGYPAVIQNKNRKHTVFLFDGLTPAEGGKGDNSSLNALQTEILNDLLKGLD